MINKSGELFRIISLGTIVLLSVSACGRYGPPQPPEFFAPRHVEDLTINAQLDGIVFSWIAPSKDQRGDRLKEIEGYRIYRKDLFAETDLLDPDRPFVEIGMIEDLHLQELDARREEARRVGRPIRKVTVPAESKSFRFTDSPLESGKGYLYKVVPINQNGTEGQVKNMVRVLFRGLSSELYLIKEGSDFNELGVGSGKGSAGY